MLSPPGGAGGAARLVPFVPQRIAFEPVEAEPGPFAELHLVEAVRDRHLESVRLGDLARRIIGPFARARIDCGDRLHAKQVGDDPSLFDAVIAQCDVPSPPRKEPAELDMCGMADEENIRRHASSKMVTLSTSTAQTARATMGSRGPVHVCNEKTVKEH
jgi:hypothetical protein